MDRVKDRLGELLEISNHHEGESVVAHPNLPIPPHKVVHACPVPHHHYQRTYPGITQATEPDELRVPQVSLVLE